MTSQLRRSYERKPIIRSFVAGRDLDPSIVARQMPQQVKNIFGVCVE
jgi:hypothetical protein